MRRATHMSCYMYMLVHAALISNAIYAARLMLLRALTVHKAQGLTLRRVTVDVGPKEPDHAIGITFVALTRVRHPGHIVLSPFACSVERLTSEIALKPSLYLRKVHEWELRKCARATALRLHHLEPPESATAPLKPKPEKPAPEHAQNTPHTSVGGSKTVSRFWPSTPKNTQQQTQQLRQRRDGAARSTMPAADADVVTGDANEPDGDAVMQEQPQKAQEVLDEEDMYETDLNEERMLDDTIMDAGEW